MTDRREEIARKLCEKSGTHPDTKVLGGEGVELMRGPKGSHVAKDEHHRQAWELYLPEADVLLDELKEQQDSANQDRAEPETMARQSSQWPTVQPTWRSDGTLTRTSLDQDEENSRPKQEQVPQSPEILEPTADPSPAQHEDDTPF